MLSQNHSYLSLAWLHRQKPYKSPSPFNHFQAVSLEAVIPAVHQLIRENAMLSDLLVYFNTGSIIYTDFMFCFYTSVDRTRYSLWKKYYHTVLVSILLLWLHFWCLLLVLSLLSNPYIFISSGFGIKIAISSLMAQRLKHLPPMRETRV